MSLFNRKKKQEKKTNQLTTGLPKELKKAEFEIVNYYTPNGVRKLKHLKFKDFPSVQFINQIGLYYQFILVKKDITITAFCLKK